MSDYQSLAQELRREYEKKIYDLEQLFEISKSLNSTLDYSRLIDSILYTIMAQMKALKACLFTKKGLDAGCFSLHRNYSGFELVSGVDYSLQEDHPVVKLFQSKYAAYSLDDIKRELGSLEGLAALESLEPALIIPLKAKGQISGVILIGGQIEGEDFSAVEREFVLNIGILAAIAISNSFLFEMTTTDMMTKLRMKHYFYQQLLEKMDASLQSNDKLCVVMIDIDHFKKFNDTYGHSCGDAVLKFVAKLIQSNVRSFDLAARYGGEEFCVLLPSTELVDARLTAERIREAVANSITEYDGLQLNVTISLGVAEYDPKRDVSGKNIIDRADKAMYVAKQSGRNRVSCAV